MKKTNPLRMITNVSKYFIYVCLFLTTTFGVVNADIKKNKDDFFKSFNKEDLVWWSTPVEKSDWVYSSHISQEDAFANFTEEELAWWSAPVDGDQHIFSSDDNDEFSSFTEEELAWWGAPVETKKDENAKLSYNAE